VSVRLWFELERPEGLNLSFPACKEQARSVAAVKDDDEGVTAQAALCVLYRCVSEGRRGWLRKGLAPEAPSFRRFARRVHFASALPLQLGDTELCQGDKSQ
jgi:hypothetical protein